MKRHIPGLHCEKRESDDTLEGIFLVRVDRAFYRWHPVKDCPFRLRSGSNSLNKTAVAHNPGFRLRYRTLRIGRDPAMRELLVGFFSDKRESVAHKYALLLCTMQRQPK
jgi:hypothetical protein